MTATATVGDKNGQQTALPEVADPLPKIQSSKWIICDKLGWPVERIELLRRETEVSGNSAVTELDTRIIGVKPGEGIPKAVWELTWIRRREGWRVTSLKVVSPQWLVGLSMIP